VIKERKKPRQQKKSIADKRPPRYLVERKEYREIKIKVILKQLEKLKEEGLITKREFENRKKQIGVSKKEIS
jgi:hypothetical protein